MIGKHKPLKRTYTIKDSLVLVIIGGNSSPVEDGAEGEVML
jgi:hypothetical protein